MKWAISIMIGLLGCSSVPIEDRAESHQVQAIVRTTNSPFCPGKTLDSCPSPRASEWRQDINEWVAKGVPDEEIRGRLQERVPDFNLTVAPVKSGWVIPVVAVLLSTLWLLVVGRALRGPTPPPRRTPSSNHAALDTRLDEELARLD